MLIFFLICIILILLGLGPLLIQSIAYICVIIVAITALLGAVVLVGALIPDTGLRVAHISDLGALITIGCIGLTGWLAWIVWTDYH